mmetsp:Transcript_1350/g.1673  ORF Transcript_1350/g.1673 Transcript_1350/m.1673 type:complete len:325 (-) Transcript_1350:577-1551(-)
MKAAILRGAARSSVGFRFRPFSWVGGELSSGAAKMEEDNFSSLSASEVTVKMIASPIAATMRGVGVVTAVGPEVKNLDLDDIVVATSSLGPYRSIAKAPSSSLIKLPPGIPVEYASVIDAAVIASGLIENVPSGDTIIQSGADTLVGQAVVQLAMRKGIKTLNILGIGTDQEECVDLLKSLGGDVVVPPEYAASWKFKNLVSDLKAPSLAVHFVPDKALLAKLPSTHNTATLRTFLEGTEPDELLQLKVAQVMSKMAGGNEVTYDARTSASVEEMKASVPQIAELFATDQLALWLESYPVEDFQYASRKATESFPGYRGMVLKF